MPYSEKVLDHFNNPRNMGSLDKSASDVGTGVVGAPECGDVMKLQIKVDDEGRITDAKFKTFGCGAAIAASSLATEWLKGRTVDQAGELQNTALAEELALPPVKIHCSVLAEDAVKAAIADWKRKNGLAEPDGPDATRQAAGGVPAGTGAKPDAPDGQEPARDADPGRSLPMRRSGE